MNKKLLILLAIAIVVIPVATACGRIAPTGITTLPAPKIPHPVDVRYANCNACHVADQLSANKPLPHTGMNYTNKDCISPACHEPETGATTTTPPPSTTTMPPSSTAGGTSPTSTVSTPPATLPTTAPAITSHSLAVLTAYKGVCLMCHGAGLSNQFPLPPSWNGTTYGSTTHTGVYTVAAGSPADHTGRTADQCTQPGCHAAPTS